MTVDNSPVAAMGGVLPDVACEACERPAHIYVYCRSCGRNDSELCFPHFEGVRCRFDAFVMGGVHPRCAACCEPSDRFADMFVVVAL